MNFKRKNIIYRTIMPLDQLIEYYRNERKYIYENNIPVKGIKWRKRIHKIMFAIIKMKRVLLHQKLTILHDEREDTDKPIIYACTHIGRYEYRDGIRINSGYMFSVPWKPRKTLSFVGWSVGISFWIYWMRYYRERGQTYCKRTGNTNAETRRKYFDFSRGRMEYNRESSGNEIIHGNYRNGDTFRSRYCTYCN